MSTTTETKEHPIIMSAESVRAILEGRKTQARRVVEFQGSHEQDNPCCQGLVQYWPGKWGWHFHNPDNEGEYKRKHFPKGMVEQAGHRCPCGRVGDLLWVQEPFRLHQDFETWSAIDFVEHENGFVGANGPVYKADGMRKSAAHGIIKHRDKADRGRKRPPEDMPRELCRLRLRVEEVRVERVRDISEEDARAEGCRPPKAGAHLMQMMFTRPCRTVFSEWWDDINGERDGGAYAWERDPWVWCVTFSRIEE